MMSPTIILKEGTPAIVLGSGGSNRIRSAILQVISNLIDFQLPLSDAVTRSRLHWEQQILNLEPLDPNFNGDRSKLPPGTSIIQWPEPNMFFGGVHAVGRALDHSLTGIGDPRRAGVAWIGQS
jgi:gamma-glutamyltranspeptidase/glutathione hydrolase